MKSIGTACLASTLLALAACGQHAPTRETTPAAAPAGIGMPNPASVHCEKLGGKLDIRTGNDGGQYGMCALPDGRVCEEWALFRDGQCRSSVEE